MIYLHRSYKLVSATKDGMLRVWDTTIQTASTDEEHRCRINDIVFSSDAQRVATASDDTTVRLWNVNFLDNRHHDVMTGPYSHATRVLFSPDDKLLAVAYSWHPIVLWDIQTQGPPKELSHTDADGRYFVRMAFSPDSRLFACSILPESRERRTRLLRGIDDSFMTYVFRLPCHQSISASRSDGPFNGMELSVNKNELIHQWSDHIRGVVDLRTGKYSVDKDVNRSQMLDVTGKNSGQSCVLEVRNGWIFHNGSPVLLLPWDFFKSVVAVHKLRSEMSLVILHS